jgi:hypothetical protein
MSYFDPRRSPVLPAKRREAARLQLEQVVARSANAGHRSKPMIIAAGATAIVLTTGAAAFAVAEFGVVTNKTQARCYTVADVASGHYTTIAQADKPGGKAQVQDALAVCAALFRQGFLTVGGPGVNHRANGLPNHPVPRLAECTMRDGTAAVFPGGAAICAKLGLPKSS